MLSIIKASLLGSALMLLEDPDCGDRRVGRGGRVPELPQMINPFATTAPRSLGTRLCGLCAGKRAHVQRDKPVDHRIDLLRHFQRQEIPGADGLGRNQLRAQCRKAVQIGEPMGRFDI